MFDIFKKRNDNQNDTNALQKQDSKEQTRVVLESTKISLEGIEDKLYQIKDKYLFSSLLLFVSYYSFIIDFYNQNIEKIISIKELIFLKYVDMIKNILLNFQEDTSDIAQKNEILKALKTVNAKLNASIKNIKEQSRIDLSVDLKTLQDLIKLDF